MEEKSPAPRSRALLTSVWSSIEQLQRAIDDLLDYVDDPDPEFVARAAWEAKMLQRMADVFDVAMEVRSKSLHEGPSEEQLFKMRGEAMCLVQTLHSNPKMRLQDWGDHSPRSVAKLRQFAGELEVAAEKLEGSSEPVSVILPKPVQHSESEEAQEADLPSGVNSQRKGIAQQKRDRGDWMLDHCDPGKLTNPELQAKVNAESKKRHWPLFDSDSGNGAFEAYKTAYYRRFNEQFRRDDRGKRK